MNSSKYVLSKRVMFLKTIYLLLFVGVRIQLIEFLVADYLLEWSKAEDFDTGILSTDFYYYST